MRNMLWIAAALAVLTVTGTGAAHATGDPCTSKASERAKARQDCPDKGNGGGANARSDQHGKPAEGTRGRSQAAPGHPRIWICHATGSATNPYVLIHVPSPAAEAHRRHQDGRDIVPAPTDAGGKPACPGAQGALVPATDQQITGARRDGKGKAWICHATGSATNPFVLINVSTSAVAAHRRHQDGRDLIPAPTDAGGRPACPNAEGTLVPASAEAIRAVGTTGSTLPSTTTAGAPSSGVAAAERRGAARTRTARRARQPVRNQGFTG